MQFDAVALTGVGQFLEHVALEGGGIHNVVVAHLALEHRETVVVARSNRDVARSSILDGTHPLVGIKARGIEPRRQLGILVTVDALIVHHPLAVGQHRINTPVDKNAKFVVLKFLAGLEVFLTGHIGRLLGNRKQPCKGQ